MQGYCSADTINTMNLYTRMRISELKSKLVKLREEYDLCDDYYIKQSIGRKIGKVTSEIESLNSSICNI